MSKAPPIPEEQRNPAEADHAGAPDISGKDGASETRRRGANLSQVSRAGNIWQNTHDQGYQQDR